MTFNRRPLRNPIWAMLTILTLVVGWAVAGQSPQAFRKIQEIGNTIRNKGTLDNFDRELLFSYGARSQPREQMFAIMYLIAASEKKLVPQDDVAKLIRQVTVRAAPMEAELHLLSYQGLIGVPTRTSPSIQAAYRRHLATSPGPSRLTTADLAFLKKVSAEGPLADRAVIARLLVPKQRLSTLEVKQALQIVAAQAARARTKPERQLWEFCRTIVTERSPVRSKSAT